MILLPKAPYLLRLELIAPLLVAMCRRLLAFALPSCLRAAPTPAPAAMSRVRSPRICWWLMTSSGLNRVSGRDY